MLTQEQQDALDTACVSNVFITGPGGVGKSVVLQKIVSTLRESNLRVLVTATTGVAAMGVGGQTICSAFSLRSEYDIDYVTIGTIAYGAIYLTCNGRRPFAIRYSDIDKNQGSDNRWVWTTSRKAEAAGVPRHAAKLIRTIVSLRTVDALVIDEISMVSSSMLRMIDILLRYAKGIDGAMGGVRTILVGDLFQLRPVPCNSDIQAGVSTVELCCNSDVWKELDLKVCILSKPHRFHNNSNVLNIMEVIRRGAWNTPQGATVDAFLKRLEINIGDERYKDWTWLFADNASKDIHNNNMMSTILTEDNAPLVSHACITGDNPNAFPTVPKVLTIAVGCRVMCIKNGVYGDDKVVCNGQLGTVLSIDGSVIVDIDNIGPVRLTQQLWEEATMIKSSNGEYIREVTDTIVQFPIDLAWALTVHKAQGMTLNKVVLVFSSVYTAGQAYVGISRVRDFNNLRLVGYNKYCIMSDKMALDYYASVAI